MLHITLDLTDEASEGLILSQIKESDDNIEIKNNNQWLMLQNALLGIKLNEANKQLNETNKQLNETNKQLNETNKQLDECKKLIMGEKI